MLHSSPQDMVAKPRGMHVKLDPWHQVLITVVTASIFTFYTLAQAFWPEKWPCTYYLQRLCLLHNAILQPGHAKKGSQAFPRLFH